VSKRFEGKVAIVTGGATGIGRAISSSLARGGARVAVVNRRAEVAEALVQELRAEGLDVHAYPGDVADATAIAAVIKQIVADLGGLHILVNNAGVTRDDLLMRMKEEAWDLVLDVNLKGAFNCIKAASRPMMKNQWGRIVNISSVVGLMGNAGQANYAAAKAGLIGLTKSAARELASRNITVNAVAPGYIPTDMTADLPQEAVDALLSVVPLKRMGEPEEIAAAVAFLASDEAAYVTGQTLCVDGGMVMS